MTTHRRGAAQLQARALVGPLLPCTIAAGLGVRPCALSYSSDNAVKIFDGIAPTTTTELTKQSHKARERRTDLTVSGVCSGFGFVRSKRYMNSFGKLRPHGRRAEREGGRVRRYILWIYCPLAMFPSLFLFPLKGSDRISSRQ